MEAIKKSFDEAGQGHVFQLWDTLAEDEQNNLLDQLKSFDPQRLNEIFESSTKAATESSGGSAVVEPVSLNIVTRKEMAEDQVVSWRKKGLEMIASGKLGILLLAGGQGTRLGSSKPKGCYDIGLPSGKSLFQIQAERIQRLQKMAWEWMGTAGMDGDRVSNGKIRWYIMTSPATDMDTQSFFKENGYFGLDEEQIVFFSQGMLPAVTEEGKIIRESGGKIAMAPDGNGGVYVALEKHGILDDMVDKGIEAVDCCSVDNVLVRLGDPVFAGYCASSGIECGARVVAKSYPEEKVGVFAQRQGKLQVVEYSELDPVEATSLDPETGILKYNWSNICLHYFQVHWLRQVSEHLVSGGTYHIAKKKIPSIDGPVPGIKLELFIFDTFPETRHWGLMEVVREEEFAPVKNAPGSANDSPDTARQAVMNLHRKWIESQGGIIDGEGGVEISPLVSYAGENLGWTKGRRFRSSEHILSSEA